MKLLYFFIFGCITAASSKICLRKDYLVNQCLKAEIENIKPLLNHEMIRLDRLQADTSINGVKMKAVFYNIAAFRLSTFKVDDLRVNLNDKSNLYVELHVTVPEMLISADYDFRGMKMFFFGFHTYGKFYGKFNNIKLVFRLNISAFLQSGDEYLRLTYVTTGVQFNHAEMHLQPRDRTYTGRKIAYYAQSDPHSALVKLTPAIEYNVARLFQKHVNDVLAKLPSKYIIKD